ncbi:cAMP-dependent protein kinase [Chloropicon primus]|uniref:cGMP-dependent protein kinase n=1 Tax=Chloropicon primus TaxID=1764295 RepID=A0A5B8MW19_9CHLO|nr:cAMP-dependent protein kinase [Chloropicon primus]UPR03644.1 cAMP-dependent protein kinase [Chloropicon primus]|eukprot:QDZ24436.1 cAMP-dependent protein kinase [Chloropicon primus]
MGLKEMGVVSRALAITGGHLWRRPSLPSSASSAVQEDFPFLIEALNKLLIFNNLPPEKQAMLCSYMYLREVPAGDILIREGEEGVAASELYVVKSGEFEVLQKYEDLNVRVNRKEAGDIFGEVALLYSVPRNATVVALSDSSVWVLTREFFNYYVRQESGNVRDIQLDIFLNSVHVIQPLNKTERQKLVEDLDEEVFLSGDIVCKQGTAANKFYIIMKGEATLFTNDNNGKEEVLTELFSGEFFGEESIAPKEDSSENIYNNTIRASKGGESMHCISIPVEKADVLRPLYEMMQREKKPELMRSKWMSLKNTGKDVPCPIFIKEKDATGKLVIVSRARGHLYEAARLRDHKKASKKHGEKSDRYKRGSVDESYIASYNAYRRRSSTRSVSSDGSNDSSAHEDLGSFLTDSFMNNIRENTTDDSEGTGGAARPQVSSASMLIRNASEEDVKEFGLSLIKGAILGSGAFSVVYEVCEERSKRKFAMKRIAKSSVDHCRSHILCEQKITRNITHPFVIRQYASFQDKKHLYFLFDYLPSGDLMDVLCGEARLMRTSGGGFTSCLKRSGDGENAKFLVGLDEKLAQFYVAQIILVLEYLHWNGIVYRDLKPENVLVDERGFVKLGDFGFAKNLKNLPEEKTTTFCGTPGYVAPENVFTQGYSYSVDFWSLGVLTYVLLTGKQPFNQPRTNDPMVVVQRIVDPHWEIQYPPYMKPAAKEFIQELLQREHQKRLGCREGGVLELKTHKWLKGIPWEMLAAKKYKPPHMPTISKRRRRSKPGIQNDTEQSFDSETKNFFVNF